MLDSLTINTDGGSRGNPGHSAGAFVVQLNKNVIASDSQYLGMQTNNFAEYSGVIMALKWLTKHTKEYKNVKEIKFILDSELVVRQLNGIYKIKDKKLIVLSLEIKKMITNLPYEFTFESVLRTNNKEADRLVNECLDVHLQ